MRLCADAQHRRTYEFIGYCRDRDTAFLETLKDLAAHRALQLSSSARAGQRSDRDF